VSIANTAQAEHWNTGPGAELGKWPMSNRWDWRCQTHSAREQMHGGTSEHATVGARQLHADN